MIDLREERRNAFDSMRVMSEFRTNEIDESDSQDEKYSEHRI
jgi:hypothetical protein